MGDLLYFPSPPLSAAPAHASGTILPPAVSKPQRRRQRHAAADRIAAHLRQIGQVIRDTREAAGMTVERLAQQAGVSPRNIRNVQAGGNTSVDTLIRLCEALELDLMIDAPTLTEKTARLIQRLGLKGPDGKFQ